MSGLQSDLAEMPCTLPVGIFDSGLGGLTALKEIRRVLPREHLIYFGDTGRVPYGTRSPQTILHYARQDVRFLLSRHIKCIVVACGTVSATALETLSTEFSVPMIGAIEPAAQRAVKETHNGKIGVIATPSTVQSHAYARAVGVLDTQAQVTECACPLFVPLVENGFFDVEDPVPRLVADRYLQPIREAGVDALILGCTHYPLLRAVIARALPGVTLIDTGVEVAHCLQKLLEQEALAMPVTPVMKGTGGAEFFVSDTPESFEKLAGIFLGDQLDRSVQRIAIDTY